MPTQSSNKLYILSRSSPLGLNAVSVKSTWNTTQHSSGAFYGRIALDPRKIGGGVEESRFAQETVTTNPYSMLILQGVSLPLASDQTIDGTVDVIARVREFNAGMNAHWRLHLYVLEGDTNNVRGILVNGHAEAAGVNEFPTALTGHGLNAPIAMSSVAALAGDRIVMELGVITYNSVTTFFTAELRYGSYETLSSSVGTDAVDGSTAFGASYLSFSNTFDFDVPAQPANDECSSAITVSTFPYNASVALSAADETDTDDPTYPTGYTHWCWYSVMPVADSVLKIQDVAPNSNAIIVAVFSGTCGTLTALAEGSQGSETNIALSAGTAYKIGVAVTGRAAFDVTFTLDLVNAPARQSVPETWSLDLSGGNTGGAFQNATGYYERTPYGSDTPDSGHPDVVSTEAVKIVSGAGPSGEDVIDYHQASGYDPNDYSIAGVALAQFGHISVTDPPLIENPSLWWQAQEGAVQADYKFTDSSILSNSFAVVFILSNSLFENAWPIQLYLDEWETDVYRFILNWWDWNGTFNQGEAVSRYFTRAELVALDWTNARIEWQSGTPTGIPFSDVADDGYIRVWLGDEVIFDIQGTALYWEYYNDGLNYGNGLWLGYWGLAGQVTNLTLFGEGAPVIIPPLQRAGYVLFSNDIVERQAETRFTKTYLMLLAADPPTSVAPGSLTLTAIEGDLYDQEGTAITSGRLYITPRRTIVVGDFLIAAKTVTYDITGPISLNLAASGGVLYDVEYDPDPDDTETPRNLKSGFFKDVWDIPSSGPVDVSDL